MRRGGIEIAHLTLCAKGRRKCEIPKWIVAQTGTSDRNE
jgi:hypothetical protein